MNTDCRRATEALAAGESADPAHLRTCAACRARAELVQGWSAAPVSPHRLTPPTVAGLRGTWRRRVAIRTTVALAAVALLAFALRPEAPAPDVDLIAVVDDADRAVEPSEPLDEDLLALLEPGDPSAAADPLVDALLGEGSL